MSKYDPLTTHLKAQGHANVPMRFAEIERVLEAKLPRSAHVHRAWWANEANGHVHAKAWLDAGYETANVDMAARKLVFRRILPAAPGEAHGLEENARMYAHEDGKPLPPHPAVGSMKGLITIAPGVDLSEPIYSEQEWDEFLERRWRVIEEGLKRK